MRLILTVSLSIFFHYCTSAQDWEGLIVPPSPGSAMVWELQEEVSDDFNYVDGPSSGVDTLGGKWINWYHNGWFGPPPTIWQRDHVWVEDGKFKIRSSRIPGQTVKVDGKDLAASRLGCAHSVEQVIYPVYVEANVKIMNSVLASNVWMLSSDDTQEIDICEAYGGTRWNNPFFSEKRLHLSHHVFIRDPFQDWQPSDPGSFYTNDSTVWRENFHRIGVYWEDSVNLKYYVDGELVRTRSGMDEIDPLYYTNRVNPGDASNDTRMGLSKPMDIILNTEDQTWRALQGLTPTDMELENEEDNTFNIDWIRVYKPVEGEVDSVSDVRINPSTINTYPDNTIQLTADIIPYNALDLSVVWSSEDSEIASVSEDGLVTTKNPGETNIIVTTNEGNKKDTCRIAVSGIPPSISFDNEFAYLNFDYTVGGALSVKCNYHAGTGNTVIEGGQGGVKFWLREIAPGWSVVKDYVISDSTTIGTESGIAEGKISLVDVVPTAELTDGNWYFLYTTFQTTAGDFLDKGIFPINIVNTSGTDELKNRKLQLHPNPASQEIIVNTEYVDQLVVLEIFSMDGKLQHKELVKVGQKDIRVDVSKLESGLYIVKAGEKYPLLGSFVKQ